MRLIASQVQLQVFLADSLGGKGATYGAAMIFLDRKCIGQFVLRSLKLRKKMSYEQYRILGPKQSKFIKSRFAEYLYRLVGVFTSTFYLWLSNLYKVSWGKSFKVYDISGRRNSPHTSKKIRVPCDDSRYFLAPQKMCGFPSLP